MRWSYKSVHYDYKKEGLLGGTFLDEAEIEQSMNEFGRAGWELVSLFEVQDGLLAIFKQPVDLPARQNVQPAAEVKQVEQKVSVERRTPYERVATPTFRDEPVEEDVVEKEEEPTQDIPASAPHTFKPVTAKTEKKRTPADEDVNGGVGSIRIE
jgi:hypothetical protein